MNFYFQSGEFLGDGGTPFLDLAVQFLGIVVGAVISILVFQMGKRNEDKKEQQRLGDLARYASSAVNDLLPVLTKQQESLRKFSNELSLPRDVNYAPQMIVSLHAKSIRWIKHDDLYKIFLDNKRNKQKNSDTLRQFNSDLD
jgi:hypothetical protein